MHLVDQRLETVGELLIVHIPVAQSCVIVLALAKPAIIHHEAVDTQSRSLLCQRLLYVLGHVPPGCFPRVVDHWSQFGTRCLGQDMRQREAVQQSRSSAHAVICIASVEDRRLQLLTWLEGIAEVEGIEAACHAHLVQRILFDGDAPRTAPRKRPKPYLAMLFARVTLTDSEPWIELNPSRSAPAFQHSLPLVNRLLIQRPFARPASAQIAQCVMRGRE